MSASRLPLSRPALIRVLTAIQNSAAFAHQDILTFSAFCDTAAGLANHVWACFVRLGPADKARALEALRATTLPVAA